TFAHDREPVLGVAFSPDGKLLATASGDDTRVTQSGGARLWNAETGELVRAFDGITRAATSVAFAANGQKLIVTSFDEKAYVFEVESGKPVGFFGEHSRPVNAIVMSLDGQTAITGSGGRARGKNEFKVWRVEDGKVLGTSDEHQARIVALALSPDGKTLATAGYDQIVRLWDVSFAKSAPSDSKQPAIVAANTTATPSKSNVADTDAKETPAAEPKPLKAGIIGLDTSHAVEFTKILNGDKQRTEAFGSRMVAAFPKGSPDIESSTSRVPGFTEQVKKMGVEIVDSIEELVKQVDVVFLETNDGRPHFEQILPVLKAGKPCFIDKPIAASLTDAVAIFEAAKKYKVPIFSSSSLRFGKNSLAARAGSLGKIMKAETSSPASLEPTHPDLFWYGIHGVESLFTVMGTGCISVKRGQTEDGMIEVIGQWTDDRVGIYRENKSGKYYGTALGDKGEGPVGSYDGYDPLLFEVLKFARSGQPPVSEAETLEIYAFMEAADESKRQGGAVVTIESVMQKAREFNKTRKLP
ncbi:MAG TPA: Gfo/Idh/MocA family oxidoreductase, partial [Planctomycetaceae bacterium]|nr:Gfo/Idh/MocA family oxidoreductase [Planctomycetaceae bacterium]